MQDNVGDKTMNKKDYQTRPEQEIKAEEEQHRILEEKAKNNATDVRKERETKTQGLRKQIEVINNSYRPSIEKLETDAEAHNKKRNTLRWELNKVPSKKLVYATIEKGYFTEESLEAFLGLNGLSCQADYGYNSKKKAVQEKKKLPNGIQVFSCNIDYGKAKVWFAMKGLDCVGLSYRRKARHPGDDTYPYSYIGEPMNKNKIYVMKENRWGNKNKTQATYTDWNKKLAETTKFVPYELTEQILKALSSAKDLDGEDLW